MSYSGVEEAKAAKETLGKALAALQEVEDVPEDVEKVTENIAQAVGALFEAERASSELDGKSAIRSALGFLSQTLALLQDVSDELPALQTATETLATAMSGLYPLTMRPTMTPDVSEVARVAAASVIPKAASIPKELTVPVSSSQSDDDSDDTTEAAHEVEVNVGGNTQSNFWMGFGGYDEAGVFLCTYEVLPVGVDCNVLVTLPGMLEFQAKGNVRFVVDPLDFTSDAEPGVGIQFHELNDEAKALMKRFIQKRAPMFYDD
jgi:hypothetical protein